MSDAAEPAARTGRRADDATDELDELVALARDAKEHAYAPYSQYPVGAAIRTPDGRLFSGCNVENAAYPEGTCAEAGAIAAMARAGERRIAVLVTVTDGPRPGSPCGGCRQKIREFATPTTRVHSFAATGESLSFTLEQLIPASFGPEMLPRR